MAFETLSLVVTDGVATLTLNRPERMNALSQRLKDELGRALHVVSTATDIRVLVMTGSGERAFCAGADLKERAATDPTPAEFIDAQRRTQELFSSIERLEQPVIAAINGAALGGGCEIALCCDIRIASEGARLGLTEVGLGVIPAGGGTQRLPRLIGPGRAKRLMMTGAVVGASDALALGLVDEVVPASELMGRVRALAEAIAAKPPLAVRFAKKAVDQGLRTDLASGLAIELYAASILFASEDRKEGMQAFLDKRVPVFKGR